MESPKETKGLVWKCLSITLLTAWIVIADVTPAFAVYQVFFDVSPTATDRRIVLHWTNQAFDHPKLEGLTPTFEGWEKADISNKWAHLKQFYKAESLLLYRYTNSEDALLYVSIMRTDSGRKLVHGLAYCYGLQGYSSISKEIVHMEPSEDLTLPINLWYVRKPESAEGWILAFCYVITYHKNVVDRAYFIQIQAHAPAPDSKDEAKQVALEFVQETTLNLLTSLITYTETPVEGDETD